ncbi:MAG: aromatic ring-hydroxylating dioxygenase subunit alpha [Anaerolineae bacterium]|jgi:phenylpropionate dioxygenase-like ring-hydroxylating dioxygenase large terminal subunit|nr:aromatic ring-hydroxylating dioxygenase subunit alpha [Anaerolineae bacterium]
MIPNQWYAVLDSAEIKPGKPYAFRRLNDEIVVWRDAHQRVVIMRDVCPHRQCQLSPGKIVDGNIQCHFHGFQYDREGDCQLIPANGRNGAKPRAFKAHVYPTREAYGLIWMWYGEPRQESDYPPIPFFEELADFDYGTIRREWNVHYSRSIENQLDISHLPFVHAKTIGRGGRTLVNGPYTVVEPGKSISVWVDNQLDSGLPATKPSAMPSKDTPPNLKFLFPNVWHNRIAPKISVFAAFAPVDEENTVIYVRFYHKVTNFAPLKWLISKIGNFSDGLILAEDQGIVETQRPKKSELNVGDRFIPADRPIVMYLLERQRLIEGTHADELNEADFALDLASR